MKKTVYIIAAISACFTISCKKEAPIIEQIKEENKDEETPAANMRTITITADVDDELDTKTYYEGGTTFNWNKDDKISIIGDDDNFYTFTANSSGSATTFTGTIPAGVELGTYAFYPADAGHTAGHFYLPRYKDLTTHESAEIPMVGTKGEGNAFTFRHCAGAALLTITNFPDGITSATITVESAHATDETHCIKLSGSFWINDRETTEPYWSGAYRGSAEEKQFSRKVNVSGNSAKVYVICPAGYDNSVPNKLTVIGHGSGGDVVFFNEKSMKKLGKVDRAHVLPLAPLPICNLANINWSDPAVFTSDLDMSSSKKCLTQLKVSVDAYYLYAKVTAPVSGFSGDFLDIFLSDGSGSHYALSDDNQYWTTGGETVYREQHQGAVTTSSISMTFNSKSVETKATNDGTDINYYMAFPRSAHPLLSSTGTVYVSFMLWNGWSCTGCIPTRYSAMMSVTLP